MIGGGKYSEPEKKRPKRYGNSIPIIQRVLGNGEPTTPTYPSSKFTQDQIETFVDNLTDGPQVISLPTPPDSHSIFVNIIPLEDGTKKVMISDWNGEAPRLLGKDHITKTGKKKSQSRMGILYNVDRRIRKKIC